ncbi:FAD-dependent oxidoreductase [Periweissella cryptocerci]|uniref:FAD-dependent oxidoreductase n=1 Tax=Periweissella cryptocerci TaxID=2506420 RepID=A0A4P6YV60_9LACO|nr:FAD-dependent oxidoreductase [Periweissella cryptocerci]QBO36688.1 FAD-dependent oxidoreductase [Periweissella cryptocerci]
MKVVIVGASHGGHEAAVELLDKYTDMDVTIYEQGDFVSFMSCGMQLFLEDKVTGVDDVRNFRPDKIEAKGGKVLSRHQVTAIDLHKKTVSVKNLVSGDTFIDTYDKLILSSGVNPATLPIKGNELDNIYLMRGRDWALKLREKLHNPLVKNVVVIGTGYIGVEAAEVFRQAGKHVVMLDLIKHPLGIYLDTELTKLIEEDLVKHGIELGMEATITEFVGDTEVSSVKTSTQEYPADLVIVAAGVKPNTDWLRGVIKVTDRGNIATDEYLRTSNKDIYALGDAILPLNMAAQMHGGPVALASATRREAQYVANHITETIPSRPFAGVLGSSALSVFDYKFASTGLNETTAERFEIEVQGSFYEDTLRPSFVKNDGNVKAYVKLIYAPATHKILGGQVMSTYDITAHANTIALAIKGGMTLEDLAEADFFFQPGFDRQWSLLNLAAKHALGEAAF